MSRKNKKAIKSTVNGLLDGLVACANICAVPVSKSDFFGGLNKNRRLFVRAERINSRGQVKRARG